MKSHQLFAFFIIGSVITVLAHEHCSRTLSRRVRTYLNREVFSLLPETFAATSLPESCPLNPRYDIFLDQEIHKHERSRSEWECGYCRKSFKNEFYIDRHMDNKHSDKLVVNFALFMFLFCKIVMQCCKHTFKIKL